MSKNGSIADRIERAMNSTTDNVVKGDLREILADLRAGGVAQAAPEPIREALDEARRDAKKLARELQQGLPKRNAAERLEAMAGAADKALAITSTHAAPRSEDQS